MHFGSQTMPALTLDSVQEARKRISAEIYYSPCAHSVSISKVSGHDVYLKLENLQTTGAFKERGALNKIRMLSEQERKQGVVAASAGNHAQGVAVHASLHGISSKIVMPTTTPLVKVNATAGYGAQVVLHGSSYDEAYEEACGLAQIENRVFIHPFDDLAVIAGQGTIALEVLEQVPDLEAIVVARRWRRPYQWNCLRHQGDPAPRSKSSACRPRACLP